MKECQTVNISMIILCHYKVEYIFLYIDMITRQIQSTEAVI